MLGRAPDHPELANALYNLALFCRDQGRYEEAESLFLRSLEITEERRGPDHHDEATILKNLA